MMMIELVGSTYVVYVTYIITLSFTSFNSCYKTKPLDLVKGLKLKGLNANSDFNSTLPWTQTRSPGPYSPKFDFRRAAVIICPYYPRCTEAKLGLATLFTFYYLVDDIQAATVTLPTDSPGCG
ncbi:putative feruloyl esterase C [Fusarium oxysporum f. sp. albedinis]|nr:putative feruloyl esterase C [Fusarium oxysporum f. sp. albedinis]